MSDAIHDKLKKLLAMASQTTVSPNEAANAAMMAAKLAAQHGIDMSSLEEQGRSFTEATIDIDFPARDDQARIWLTSAVARMYAVKALVVRRASTRRVCYVGAPHNVEAAGDWTKYLWDACKRANTAHARENAYGSREARELARSTFRFGFCQSVSKRIIADVEQMKIVGLPESGSTALVVTNYFDKEIAEVEAWMKSNRAVGEAHKGRAVSGSSSALHAGRRAGDSVSLNRQLT